MLAGSALITAYSLDYFDPDTVPPFVIERLPEHFASLWLGALRVHVAAALLSLPLCLVLTTRWLQRRLAWHRWLGRIAGTVVLVVLVPTGVVLAFNAKGGPVVTAGFLLTAGIIAYFMIRGVAAVRRRNLGSHQRAMRHLVGQMSVAVTSRAMLLALDAARVDPAPAYVIALWVPVLASAAVAEIVSLPPGSVAAFLHRVSKGFRREISSLPDVVRPRSLPRPMSRFGR